MTAVPKPKRRPFQISLRTLLLLVTVVGCAFGLFSYKLRQVQRQRDAVRAIEELSGFVYYDYQLDSACEFKPGATPTGPAWLRQLLGDDFFANVIYVHLSTVDMNSPDVVFACLESLAEVKVLDLWGPDLAGNDLSRLHRLSRLRFLSIGGTRLVDADLIHFEGLIGLEGLCLLDPQFSDAGLLHLKRLSRLKELSLGSLAITDAGLAQLRGLTKLESLYLGSSLKAKGTRYVGNPVNTHITEEGCEVLKNALPNLKIER